MLPISFAYILAHVFLASRGVDGNGSVLRRNLSGKHIHSRDDPDAVWDALEEIAETVEEAVTPEKGTRNQWKDSVKQAKKGTETDAVDEKVTEEQYEDAKKPWKSLERQREFVKDTANGREEAKEYWKESVASALLWFIFTGLFAFYYRRHYASEDLKYRGSLHADDWSTGICDVSVCIAKPSLCGMACLCPAVRWSQTVSMAQVMRFWPAFLCFSIANLFTLIPILGTPFAAALDTYDRIELRRKLGMPDLTCCICVRDCCCFMCCAPCMIVQEAHHVEELSAAGY